MNRGPYPWKEDGGNYGDFSLIDSVKKLSRLRRENPALIAGDLRMLPGDKNILAYERMDGKSRIVVAMNNAHEPRTFRADNGRPGWKILADGAGDSVSTGDNGDFIIQPAGYLVLKAN
jgi:hypothetical protein